MVIILFSGAILHRFCGPDSCTIQGRTGLPCHWYASWNRWHSTYVVPGLAMNLCILCSASILSSRTNVTIYFSGCSFDCSSYSNHPTEVSVYWCCKRSSHVFKAKGIILRDFSISNIYAWMNLLWNLQNFLFSFSLPASVYGFTGQHHAFSVEFTKKLSSTFVRTLCLFTNYRKKFKSAFM